MKRGCRRKSPRASPRAYPPRRRAAAALGGADHRTDVVTDAASLIAADVVRAVVGADQVSVDAGNLDVY